MTPFLRFGERLIEFGGTMVSQVLLCLLSHQLASAQVQPTLLRATEPEKVPVIFRLSDEKRDVFGLDGDDLFSVGEGESANPSGTFLQSANFGDNSENLSLATNEGSPLKRSGSQDNFFVAPRSTATQPETDPPRYVRPADQIELPFFQSRDWLDIGIDFRSRYEFRQNDLRRPEPVLDQPFLTRSRAYLGVRERFDPMRGYVEFEDARRYNSQFPRDNRDVNELAFIQAVGELHFDDGVGFDRPLKLQFGRMAHEYVDRRLIARNEWRNTTNSFQGFRAILGQEKNDWQIDLIAWQPIFIFPDRRETVDRTRLFYGGIGNWRGWSDVITLQPYYLVLDKKGLDSGGRRNIHTAALRGYGIVDETGWDFDGGIVLQYGLDDGLNHRAFAFSSELGYTWAEVGWQPRLSGFCGYGSGDRDPNDDSIERFDRLFGFRRPWSANDYVGWDNVLAPKIRLDFQPSKQIRIDLGYGAFWLASATDSWTDVNLHDPTGQSGTFKGHELDIRIRGRASQRTDLTLGYAYFSPGEFTRNQGRPEPTNFFYLETLTRAFK